MLKSSFFSSRTIGKIRKKLSIESSVKYRGSKKLLFLTYLASFVLLSILVGTFFMIILFAYFSHDLPDPNRLLERSFELSTKIYDRNEKPIYEVYGDKNRTLITLDQVAPSVMNATLATEDSEFYLHKGFSVRGMARAVKNMITGGGLQSGSTLTQQVVKNALLTQDRTVTRKIKEFILSLQLENRYSKDQIMQMYLNETPYGGQNYGIFTAARAYFNKNPKDLSTAESAYLAGLPQRPSYYSHYGSNPEAGLERKNYVLYLMNKRGWISVDGKRHSLDDSGYETAKNEELKFQSASVPFDAPHFVFYVRQILADKFGEGAVDSGGLQVTTTLDLDLQNKSQQIVYDEVTAVSKYGVGNGSMVVLDAKTGGILAMVGSKGYFLKSEPEGCISGITGPNSCTFEPNLNVALARRQPGSTIKPITYATMLSQGYITSFPFLDVQTTFAGATPDKPFIPVDYDGIFRGPMSLRKSLGNSINIPAVKALKIVGIDSMINQAEKMGITTLKDRSRYGLALTLGGGETKLLEMTGAFDTFADKGKFHEPFAILKVKDSHGNVIYDWRDNGGVPALGEDVAFLISDILSDDGARSEVFGAGSLLNIPGNRVAVKTGTTDDKRDNYAIGYTPSYVVGVWVGNNNNDKMNSYIASGITGATPIWREMMLELLKNKKPENFVAPSNVKKMNVDVLTGMLPFEDYATRPEWFIQGTEPTAISSWYKKIEICKNDKKIANDACKNAGKTKVNTYIKITAELPEWQDSVDKWVQDHYGDDSKYFPPTSTSHLEFDGDKPKNSDSVSVDIINFKNDDIVPLEFRLSAEVSSGNDIDQVLIYLDGNKVTTDHSEPYGYNFKFSPDEVGDHAFKVVAQDSNGNEGQTSITLKVRVVQ